MAVTMGHPIAAIATGHGRSGIGILRMSGEGCIERAAKVFSRADGKPLEAAGIPRAPFRRTRRF